MKGTKAAAAMAATILALSCGASAMTATATTENADYRVDIVSPADGATVFNDNGDVFIRGVVMPGIAGDDRVELLLDGVPAAEGTMLEFPLSGVRPGEHVLQARIIDSTGNVGAISASSILYMFNGENAQCGAGQLCPRAESWHP